MRLWYGYVGRWIINPDGTRWWEKAEGAYSDLTKPAVGTWFIGTLADGRKDHALYVKVFDNPNEALREYQLERQKGNDALMWDSDLQTWGHPIPMVAQGLRNNCACAGRRR